MEKHKVNCYILDAVDDDFEAIWVLISTLRRKFPDEPDEVIIEALENSLNFLFEARLITMFDGRAFTGDQRPIPSFRVDRQFIQNHMNDWKTKKFMDRDYRIAITKRGVEYMQKNCSRELFLGKWFDESAGQGRN